MSAARTDLALARRQIADLCERLGLANADILRRAYVQNSSDETRRELQAVVHVAGVIHGVATACQMRAPRSEELRDLVSCATVLDDAAQKAIALCDTVIRERAELAANPNERPRLSPVRLPGVGRATDDR